MKITGYTESSGPVLPFGHTLHHPIGDRGDGLLGHLARRTPRPGARRSPHGSIPWPTTRSPDHRPRSAAAAASRTSCGSKLPSRSRGTSISTGPASVKHASCRACRCGNCRRHGRPDRACRSRDDRPARPPAPTRPPPSSAAPAAHPPRSAATPRARARSASCRTTYAVGEGSDKGVSRRGSNLSQISGSLVQPLPVGALRGHRCGGCPRSRRRNDGNPLTKFAG